MVVLYSRVDSTAVRCRETTTATGDWARWDKSRWRQTNTNCDKCPFSKGSQRVTGHQMNHGKKREELQEKPWFLLLSVTHT